MHVARRRINKSPTVSKSPKACLFKFSSLSKLSSDLMVRPLATPAALSLRRNMEMPLLVRSPTSGVSAPDGWLPG